MKARQHSFNLRFAGNGTAIALVYIGVTSSRNSVGIDKDFRICKTGHDMLVGMEI